MLEIKVNVAFEAEDRRVLEKLADALCGRVPVPAKDYSMEEIRAAVDEITQAVAAQDPVQQEPAPVEPFVNIPDGIDAEVPFDESPAAPAAKEYSLEEIRSRVMALSRQSAEMKAQVKAALNKYADTVPHLKKEDYAAFMADLEVLG